MISVVIPLYNKETSICHTLQTVLNQSYQDFEIVIVNDGSTDRSVEEAEKVKDARIRIIHQTNAGVSAARNKGIAEAKGEYIAFLDADDEWNKDYLQTQYDLTQKYPECAVFACNYIFKDTQGKVTETILRKLPFDGMDGILTNYFEVASNSHPPLWTSAVMARKSVLQAVGSFPVGIKSGEDLLTWARLASRFKIAFCTESKAAFIRLAGNAMELADKIRVPEEPDVVGRELLALLKQSSTNDKLGHYLSSWYKMRSNLYYRAGLRKKSTSCALKAIWYRPLFIKNWGYLAFNFMPRKIVSNLMGRL